MPREVRVGFIGAGAICRSRHLPGLAAIPGVKVVAVCNRTEGSGRAIAGEFNIPEVMTDWRALVARADLDAVFIGAWPNTHKEMSIAALEAGKHVFCQARMARDLDEAKAMLAAAKAKPQLVNMICPPPTRMPFEPYIRRVLAEGVLGRLTLVELLSASQANLNENAVHWREKQELSGRQVLAMGIYAETLNAWVGPYDQLTANLATPLALKRDESGAEVAVAVPQVVTITGRLAGGALVVERHTGLATDATTPGDQLTLWGMTGTLRYRFGNEIELALRGQPLKTVTVADSEIRGWLVERDFIDAVRLAQEGKPWRVSPDFEEGLAYMRKVEAVHRSAALGQTIRLASL